MHSISLPSRPDEPKCGPEKYELIRIMQCGAAEPPCKLPVTVTPSNICQAANEKCDEKIKSNFHFLIHVQRMH